MTNDLVQEAFESAMTGVRSGIRIGRNPTEEDIRKEVVRLEQYGLGLDEIRCQLGQYFRTSNHLGDKEMELLKLVIDEQQER